MKRLLFVAVAMCVVLLAQGKDIKITKFRHAGPYAVQMPIVIDSLGVDSKPFKAESMLDAPLRLDLVKGGQVVDTIVERHSAATALHLLGFQVQTVGYAKAKVNVRGLKHQQLFVDGKQLKDKEVSLLPGTHDVVVKYLTQEAGRDTVTVTLSSDSDLSTLLAGEGKRVVTINDFDNGLRIGTLNLSYDGRYCITSYSETLSTGKTSWRYRVSEMKTGRLVEETDKAIRWMPRSCRYYYTQTSERTLKRPLCHRSHGAVSHPDPSQRGAEGRQRRASISGTRRPTAWMARPKQPHLLRRGYGYGTPTDVWKSVSRPHGH